MADSASKPDGSVVLVVNAGSEAGTRVARDLLGQGYRVAATDRNMTNVARILHGHSAGRVFAIAADLSDPWQAEQLPSRYGTSPRFMRPPASWWRARWMRSTDRAVAVSPGYGFRRPREVEQLFRGRQRELCSTRTYAPSAQHTACRLSSLIGPRVSELCLPRIGDRRWELGTFGKLPLQGKGSQGRGAEGIRGITHNYVRRAVFVRSGLSTSHGNPPLGWEPTSESPPGVYIRAG